MKNEQRQIEIYMVNVFATDGKDAIKIFHVDLHNLTLVMFCRRFVTEQLDTSFPDSVYNIKIPDYSAHWK